MLPTFHFLFVSSAFANLKQFGFHLNKRQWVRSIESRSGKFPTMTTKVPEKEVPPYFEALCEWTEMSVQDQSSEEYGGSFQIYLNARKNG
jgi:hypothetical protein